jgi:hypothetical protein
MHYSNLHLNAIRVMTIVGIISGFVTGVFLIVHRYLFHNIGFLILFIFVSLIANVWIFVGLPSIWEYWPMYYFQFCFGIYRDEMIYGCLSLVLGTFIFIPLALLLAPLALIVVLLIIAPIKSIRILLTEKSGGSRFVNHSVDYEHCESGWGKYEDTYEGRTKRFWNDGGPD